MNVEITSCLRGVRLREWKKLIESSGLIADAPAEETALVWDGDELVATGSRAGQIENFHLLHHFIYNRFTGRYLLVGCIGKDAEKNLEKLDAQQKMQSDLIL